MLYPKCIKHRRITTLILNPGLSVRKLVGGEPVIVGGDLASAEGAMLLGGSGGMLPREKNSNFMPKLSILRGFF